MTFVALVFGPSGAIAAATSAKVAFFGYRGAQHFQTQIQPLFSAHAKCADCSVHDFSAFDDKSFAEQSTAQREINLLAKMKEVGNEHDIVFFDFNLRNSEGLKPHRDLLAAWHKKGKILIANAGVAGENEPTLPLSRTFLGNLKGVVLLGELMERDRLLTGSFYGPEMLTALRPNKDQLRQGVMPWIFVSTLSGVAKKRSNDDWISHFESKKRGTRKLWLDLSDLLSAPKPGHLPVKTTTLSQYSVGIALRTRSMSAFECEWP